MTRLELKEYAMMNVEEFEFFMDRHEKRCICMFASYINVSRDYICCFLDFVALIFYMKTAKNLKFKEIEIKNLFFNEEFDEWEANA